MKLIGSNEAGVVGGDDNHGLEWGVCVGVVSNIERDGVNVMEAGLSRGKGREVWRRHLYEQACPTALNQTILCLSVSVSLKE